MRAADAAHKIHILHHRHLRVAAERPVARARNQQALIAVRQAEDAAAPGDERLDASRLGGRIVEGETESRRALGVFRRGHEAAHGLGPTRAWPRIGVKKKQPCAPRRIGARGQLPAPAAWSGDDARAVPVGAKHGVVGRAAIGDHDLEREAFGARVRQFLEEPVERSGCVERGNDDTQGYVHGITAASNIPISGLAAMDERAGICPASAGR